MGYWARLWLPILPTASQYVQGTSSDEPASSSRALSRKPLY